MFFGPHKEEAKRKISKKLLGHAGYWKGKSRKGILSLEARNRIRLSKLGDLNPMRRPEVREKAIQTRLKRGITWPKWTHFQKGHIPWNVNVPMKEEVKEKVRQARLKQIPPTKDTKIEIKMQVELNKRNITFEKQKSLLNRFIVDLFIKPNIVIECDGCLYHACKQCNFTKYYQDVPAKDIRKNEALLNAGYSVYRFWEHEINKSPEDCINKIIK